MAQAEAFEDGIFWKHANGAQGPGMNIDPPGEAAQDHSLYA